MSALEKQISDMYNKAFYDIIDETINSEKPDYNWIVNLYSEIKSRLLKYIKKDSKTYKQIDEQFDIILFRQTIENNVFDMDSLLRLVNTTYYWIKMLQAPIRDESTEQSKNSILTAKPEKMVSTYIREVNKCLDYLDEDLIKFLEMSKENS